MKKLMIAAAVAAMGTGAFAECFPGEEVDVARVYQVQMNVYTTKGVFLGNGGTTTCAPGEDCLVKRGRDKTVIRGYVYVCGEDVCSFSDYTPVFADYRRKAAFADGVEFEWTILNVMGSKDTDVECAWTFGGEVAYDDERAQTYTLTGAGYGQYAGIFNNLSGYFAGTVTAPYDLRPQAANECLCTPSQVINCESEMAELTDADSVAFGAWKMKYNAAASNWLGAFGGDEDAVKVELTKRLLK